uniref:BZIP domain-containing protein n=1 Tax=Schmidtea mediterranea TaxID=79327 RepID=I1ZIA7_SCHMD|nr:hypothetical protein [Schmidtea mediterranea]
MILKDRFKRDQNNESSKKSRANRKRKFQQMKEESDSLEVENRKLERKIMQINDMIKKYQRKLNESFHKK